MWYMSDIPMEMSSRQLYMWLEVQERGQDRRYIFECYQPRYDTLGMMKNF